jgi:hypothetical protein
LCEPSHPGKGGGTRLVGGKGGGKGLPGWIAPDTTSGSARLNERTRSRSAEIRATISVSIPQRWAFCF